MTTYEGKNVIERYYQELLGYLRKTLGDKHLAADIAQEAYVKVLTAQSKAIPIREPRAFLYRTAHNLMMDEFRRTKRHNHTEHVDIESISEYTHEEHKYINYYYDIVLDVINTLPPRCKEAFLLHKFEGYTNAEVAQMMGISTNMVEKHVIKALVECKRALQEWKESK